MKKEDKGIIINKIAETLNEYSCFYLVETAGLNAERTSALRRACSKSDIKLMVVKNTLLHKALEGKEGDYSEIYGALKGATSQCSCETPEGFQAERRCSSPPESRICRGDHLCW